MIRTAITLSLAIACQSASAQTSPAEQLETANKKAATKIKAAAFLDVQGCGIHVSIVSGVADRKTKATPSLDMPLRIASVGKLYTAAAIHRLAARGEVNLDTPVSQMLKADDAVGVAGRDATLRQLLNHTGGVPDYYALPNISKWDWQQPFTPQRIMTAIANRSATAPPGMKFTYSNSGYHLAALAVERKTGRSFSALIEEEVIAPLGVRNTSYNETAPGGTLHGYVGSKDWITSAENTGPDSGITATIVDARMMLRALFLDEGPLRATGTAMTANPVETGKPRQQQGAGADIRESREGLSVVGHTGDVEGYLTFAFAAPAQNVTMIGHISASDPAALAELLRTTVSVVATACQVG